MAPKKVLFVLTNVSQIPGTDKHIGWWLSEVAHPYHAIDGKAEIVLASPKGGLAPVDPTSVQYSPDEISQTFYKEKRNLYENTEPIKNFLRRSDEFNALYYPGGHGPMFDIATDADSIELIREFVAKNKTLAAVCHGPSAFVNVVLPCGRHLLDGKAVTALSNAEEESFHMADFMPFSLETRLNEVTGGRYTGEDGHKDEATVIVEDNGKLITGQNPNSGKRVGEAILAAIGAV
ncbi:ThiJ/PfpI family protein [Xylariales sp. PMI_506]|nr:ThiJ/PfpI family protein [Xylariales sp. PMI_506]